MNNYQINVNQLPVGARIYVEGEVSFSRIAHHIEGEELAKDAQRRQARGMTPISNPYTSITVQNAEIRAQNPGQLSIAEQYIQERFYTSNSQPADNKKYYSSINKSQYLPTVSQFNPADNTAAQVNLDGKELAAGLKVILCLSVYKPKSYHNNGVGLDGVIVMEPIRYYTSSNQDLSALGITYKPLPGDEARAAVTPTTLDTQNADMGTAMNAPVPDPVGNQFSSQEQNANQNVQQAQPMAATPVYNAPTANAQPVQQTQAAQPTMNQGTVDQNQVNSQPAGPWICPNCGNTNSATTKFCGNCGTQKQNVETAASNPYAANSQSAQPTAGIVYDADSTRRDY